MFLISQQIMEHLIEIEKKAFVYKMAFVITNDSRMEEKVKQIEKQLQQIQALAVKFKMEQI